MKQTLAKININVETKQTQGLSILQNLRFRCRRCAIFCCKLGGPKLNGEDIERIERAGHCGKDFLEPRLDKDFAGLTRICGSMRGKEDGSCVFLGFDVDRNFYECLIYDSRPTLCAIYPFYFDRISLSSVLLKVIPCCRGLKHPEGELVDEQFVNNHLLDALLKAMQSSYSGLETDNRGKVLKGLGENLEETI